MISARFGIVATMLKLFAHAGEVHETATEAASHTVLTSWYIALPMFVIFMFGLASIVYLLSHKSKATTANVVLAALFIVGVGLYKASPVVSMLAISVGFALALLHVMLGLSKPSNRHSKR